MGIAQDQFWALTFREIDVLARAWDWHERRRHARERRSEELAIVTAWLAEAFHRSKRLRPLATYLPGGGKADEAPQKDIKERARDHARLVREMTGGSGRE